MVFSEKGKMEQLNGLALLISFIARQRLLFYFTLRRHSTFEDTFIDHCLRRRKRW